MDADCLIKLTKAGLKEDVCRHERVSIPAAVHSEVVSVGLSRGHADAEVVARNVDAGALRVVESDASAKGDAVLLPCFRAGRFDAVATDDAKLLRRLRQAGVPVAVPGALLLRLVQAGAVTVEVAFARLAALRPYISDEEHAAVRLLLERTP